MTENKIKQFKQDVYDIIGAAMEVHSQLRFGLLEAVYEESLWLELADRGIAAQRQQEIEIYYKRHLLEKRYKMDLVIGDIVVELKSSGRICSAHRAQLCNYLRLTHKPVGVLINFGTPTLQGERWLYDSETNECILVDKNLNPVFSDEDLFGDGTEYTDENK